MSNQPKQNDLTLLDALGAARGVVCFVGAGGKKTTMYALASAHPGKVLLSSTSHMYRYRSDLVDKIVMLENNHSVVPDLSQHRVVALATATATRSRVGGLNAAKIQTIFQQGGFDVCYIKSDGARSRWIKTPAAHEPLIPDFANTVVPIVSSQVLDCELNGEIAHRPERIAETLEMTMGSKFTDAHLINLLTNPNGALKGVGDAQVIPLINMVDDECLLVRSRAIARAALQRSERIAWIVLGSMKDARILEIVTR